MFIFGVVSGQRRMAQAACPGRLQLCHLPVHRALMVVRAGQVAAGDQEFLDDLPAGENEGLLKDLNAITTRKASYFQRKSFSNRRVEIIPNTKAGMVSNIAAY
jgi:hypothetical protein